MKILLTVFVLFFPHTVFGEEKEVDKKYSAWLDDEYFECPYLFDALMNGYEIIAYAQIPGDREKDRYTTYLIKNDEMILKYIFFGIIETGTHRCQKLFNTEEEVMEVIGDRIFD